MKKKEIKSRSNSRLNIERIRLEKVAINLNAAHDTLGRKVKRQTNQLSAKNKALQQGEERQKVSEEQAHIRTKAMEATSDGILIIDAVTSDFPVIYANPAFYAMTGYTKREIIGQHYFYHYGSDADPRVIKEIKRALQEGLSFQGEMLNFRKDGQKYWNLLRLTPVRDSNGHITHYIGIKTDITLMRQKDLEIGQQREELLHVTRVGKLAEFVSSLAHEISQPLTAILSYAQAAQRMLNGSPGTRATRDAQIKEIFQHIINDDQRAGEVIRRLRALLKKSVSETKLFDMNDLINETIVLIMTDVTVRNTTLKFEADETLPLVWGDRIQFQQVLLNLISNSFDAMESNQGSREILIQTMRKNFGTIMVSVKDSGCGIPDQNLPKLFEHFFTSKPDGLGMGLSISRSIVEEHGGLMDVKNNPDRGVTFRFTVPVGTKGAP